MVDNDMVTFTACKYLVYDDNYAATKNLISSSGTTKVVWQRTNYQLCQFCDLRGRINSPTGCLDKSKAQCHQYEDFIHVVPLASVDTT